MQRALNASPNSNKILLNTALLQVDQTDPDFVQILTKNTKTGVQRRFRAKKLISSIPVNQYAQISFEPELPYYKRSFFKFYQTGNYIKYIVTYRTAFWRSRGFSGEGTLDSSVRLVNEEEFEASNSRFDTTRRVRKMPNLGVLTEIWDGTNEEDQPALVGFIAGKAALQWAEQTDELRKKEVIDRLAMLFGNEARDYIDYIEKNWTYEPYNGGIKII